MHGEVGHFDQNGPVRWKPDKGHGEGGIRSGELDVELCRWQLSNKHKKGHISLTSKLPLDRFDTLSLVEQIWLTSTTALLRF
jgi:hypothetical protein